MPLFNPTGVSESIFEERRSNSSHGVLNGGQSIMTRGFFMPTLLSILVTLHASRLESNEKPWSERQLEMF